jgi:hypothetical protein
MTPQEIKNKKVEVIQEVIFRAYFKEPKLSMEELSFAICFHLGEELTPFLKAYIKETKNKF